MRRIATLLIPLLLASANALAHHAPAVFDQTRTIVIEGTVTAFVWENPHSWIRMDVVGDDGKVVNWSIEMNPPTYLIRGGWKSSTLKAGDKIRIVANPIRSGEPSGKYVSVTLPDGRVLGEQEAVLGEK
jgi:Family of unknown function (DUF6152)